MSEFEAKLENVIDSHNMLDNADVKRAISAIIDAFVELMPLATLDQIKSSPGWIRGWRDHESSLLHKLGRGDGG